MIIPSIYSMFDFHGLRIESIENNISYGISTLKNFLKFLDPRSWEVIFQRILKPFIEKSILVLKQNSTKKTADAKEIFDGISKISLNTLMEFFNLVKENDTDEIELTLRYLRFLGSTLSLGSEKMIKVLFEFYELSYEISSETEEEKEKEIGPSDVSVDPKRLNKVLSLALESSLKICPTELLDNEATRFVKNSNFKKFDLLTKSVDSLDLDKDEILTKSIY